MSSSSSDEPRDRAPDSSERRVPLLSAGRCAGGRPAYGANLQPPPSAYRRSG
jgi:hypothetical protein